MGYGPLRLQNGQRIAADCQTDTYTAAHQLASEDTSNSAYVWARTFSTLNYTPNVLNQYGALNGTIPLAYDANGNYLGAAASPTFAYDAENRLVTATSSSGITYVYDPLGRRVAKTVSVTTTPNTVSYLHDGDSEIAEYDGSGVLIRRFVPGPAIDEYAAMITAGGTTTFFHANRQGSIVAMAGTTGALTEGPYIYDAYGSCFNGRPTPRTRIP